ncbi:MAG: TetR/AcrR family transcriptional regulator [Spirochaetia bacterium]|jgi:AcrR family transcriptional regulator|nr:TetR/AcrR family transcriptional regulator [Spirochaetia bacterium]
MGRDRKIDDISLIIDAALSTLEESGMENLSARKLTAQLHISPMTLYNYVDNRDALLKLLLKRGFEELWSGLREKLEYFSATDKPLRIYIALAEHMLQFGLQRPNLYRFLFSSDIARLLSDETLAREYRSISQTLLPRIQDISKERDILDDIYMFQVLINALILGIIDKKVGISVERFPVLVKRAYDSLLLRDEGYFK